MSAEHDNVKDSNTMNTTSPASLDTERTELFAELAVARKAVTDTVVGLTDEQLGERPTVSQLCLGGLIKHVTATEANWTRFAVEGSSAMTLALPDGVTWTDITSGTAREYPQWIIDRQNEFQMLPGDTLAGILAAYEQVAIHTEKVFAELPELSVRQSLPEAPWGEPATTMSMRQVLLHLITETAQHAGHADIVREALDGRTAT